jgi:hypothetical protein
MADNITYSDDVEQNCPIGGILPMVYYDGITEIPDNFAICDGSYCDDERSDYFYTVTLPDCSGFALANVDPDGDDITQEVGSDSTNVSISYTNLNEDAVLYGATDTGIYSGYTSNVQTETQYIRTYSCETVQVSDVTGYGSSYNGLLYSWSLEENGGSGSDNNVVYKNTGTRYYNAFPHTHTVDTTHDHSYSLSESLDYYIETTKTLGSGSGVDVPNNYAPYATVLFIIRIW